MTFDERVRALDYLGFTPRQTRFLVTTALHSGFCLRRQYAAFAGLEYGKNVRNFLDGLADRHLATRLMFDVNRGHVYHLNARSIYTAIGQEGNRNRRVTAPPLVARKLMLLDFVLSEPADEWFATESDKVALFRDRFSVPLAHLPRRVYVATDRRTEPGARYFIDKLPIFLLGDPPVVHFACLLTEAGGSALTSFLWDHRGLLARLPHWAVVLVSPAHSVNLSACRTVFSRFMSGALRPRALRHGQDLRAYFATRWAIESNDIQMLSAKAIDRFHTARRQFAGALIESLYADWLAQGETAIERLERPSCAPVATAGKLLTRELSFTYTQVGKLPGVA